MNEGEATVEVTVPTETASESAGIDPVEFGRMVEKCQQLEAKVLELESRQEGTQAQAEAAVSVALDASANAQESQETAEAAVLLSTLPAEEATEETGPIEEVIIPNAESLNSEERTEESESEPARRTHREGWAILL